MRNVTPSPFARRAFPRLSDTLLFAALLGLSGCAELGLSPTMLPHVAASESRGDYAQVITVLKPLENLPIVMTHLEGIRYRVEVKNTSATLYKLIWDDSTYVSTSGISIRLIRLYGKNLPDNLHAPQASSPIAAHSEFQAIFSGDRWIELAMEGGLPKPKDALRKGRFTLVFEVQGKRVEWQGEMAFIAKKSRMAH